MLPPRLCAERKNWSSDFRFDLKCGRVVDKPGMRSVTIPILHPVLISERCTREWHFCHAIPSLKKSSISIPRRMIVTSLISMLACKNVLIDKVHIWTRSISAACARRCEGLRWPLIADYLSSNTARKGRNAWEEGNGYCYGTCGMIASSCQHRR